MPTASTQNKDGTGSRWWLWLLIAILALILIGIVVYVIIRYKRGEIGPGAENTAALDDFDDDFDADGGAPILERSRCPTTEAIRTGMYEAKKTCFATAAPTCSGERPARR